MSSTTIRSALVSVALSFTNGIFDTALTRRMAYNKAGDLPAEIRKAILAKLDEALAQVDPEKHDRLKVTFYVPQVELE